MAEMEFDDETLSLMKAYCGRDPRIAITISITALEKWGNDSWTIAEFAAMLDAACLAVPENVGDAALVELTGYEGERPRLIIRYDRLQTPEEVAKDVQK